MEGSDGDDEDADDDVDEDDDCPNRNSYGRLKVSGKVGGCGGATESGASVVVAVVLY